MGAGAGYGFAVMSTDTGHNSTTGDITWAVNQPEKKIDFGYRAMHGSIVLAKQNVQDYYNCKPRYSYYSGCSTGGRQGLKDIELYPEDFDGVVAGAPAWWTSHLQTWTVKLGSFNLPVGAANHIPPALFNVVAAEVLKQCDGQDGLKDTIISDPAGCNFYPEALLCNGTVANQTAAACLTSPQIETLYKIYNAYVATNDTFVFPGLEKGSEEQWTVLLGGSSPNALGTEYVQDFLLNDPVTNRSKSVFAHVELHPAPDFNIIGGIRYTDDKKTYQFSRRNLDGSLPSGIPLTMNWLLAGLDVGGPGMSGFLRCGDSSSPVSPEQVKNPLMALDCLPVENDVRRGAG